VLAIDETAELKAGEQTVGVAAQYAGITGQVENCQTVVFAAYVTARGARVDGLHVVAVHQPDLRGGRLRNRCESDFCRLQSRPGWSWATG
jgi:hypothetical protein